MAKSSTGYMKELEALLEAGEFNSSRSDYIFDIMENRGFSASNILEHIQGGNRGLPDKYKRGGTVSRKSGGKIMQGYKAGGKV